MRTGFEGAERTVWQCGRLLLAGLLVFPSISCLTIYGSSSQRLIRNKPKLRPDTKWSGRDTLQCERIGRCFPAWGVSLAG